MSKSRLKVVLISLAIVLAACILGPLCVPYPSTEGQIPPQALADPDSRFININGVSLHYKEYGEGEPVFILLHGTLANTYTWHEVVSPLAESGHVIIYDRPSFGLASRPMPGEWRGESPYSYEAQTDLLVGMMDAMDIDRAILVGNSMGGSIAAYTAQRYPERVQALILLAPAQTSHGVSPAVSAVFSMPQLRRLGPYFIRNRIEQFSTDLYEQSWHDPSQIEQEDWDAYLTLFQIEEWDRALWELITAARPFETILEFETITTPTLLVTGDDDRIIGTDVNMQLADIMPNADLVIIPDCGHVPQEECPTILMAEVEQWLQDMQLTAE